LDDADERSIELEPGMIVTRLLMSYFVSVFLINVALFNAVTTLLEPHSEDYWGIIRKEVEETLGSSQVNWSKEKVDKLWITDSYIKETMRFTGDTCYEMRRKVRVSFPKAFGSSLCFTKR
jgi:hypothetical protein